MNFGNLTTMQMVALLAASPVQFDTRSPSAGHVTSDEHVRFVTALQKAMASGPMSGWPTRANDLTGAIVNDARVVFARVFRTASRGPSSATAGRLG